MSRCRGTLQGEGHSAAGWGIGGSVIAADCGVQSPFIWAMGGGRYLRCATCVIASQYATSSCKPLLFWFPCKRWYIKVRPLTFFSVVHNMSVIQ